MDIKVGDVIIYYTIGSKEIHGIVKELVGTDHFNVFWIDKHGMKSGLPNVLCEVGFGKWWFKVDD